MPVSSRFAVAIHILALLDNGAGEPVTSEWIARSVNTNPAVIRRILSMLARAGITTSRLGTGGGALLARPVSQVTLLEVYRAVEEGGLFALHNEPPSQACPIGRHIQTALDGAICAAQRALEKELDGRTVADVIGELEEAARV